MRAGPLRQRIALDEPVTSRNETGEELVTFTERVVVPGRIEPLHGNERLQANAITGMMDVRIRIRWLPMMDDMTTKWRLRHVEKGTIYNIASIANVEMRDREVEVMASTGLNEG